MLRMGEEEVYCMRLKVRRKLIKSIYLGRVKEIENIRTDKINTT
jgi:hypothetical protein